MKGDSHGARVDQIDQHRQHDAGQAAEDRSGKTCTGDRTGAVRRIGRNCSRHAPERHITDRIEELPYEISNHHIGDLRAHRSPRHQHRPCKQKHRHDRQRNRDHEQIRPQLAEAGARLIDDRAHDRVVDRIPDALDKKHGGNNRRINAENIYKKVCKIRRHKRIAHILPAACDPVGKIFPHADIPPVHKTACTH